ncbi:Tumor necrosis factor receptor superfamily member 21 [Tripterygium wilfordii]|uniref:Tumor necrosis factor receptor superfamily member 21 n=2 Tax=Tripterygium wilfordii TaxID=458696 RepID=A0A7J7CLP1_TRIWF|nr:Tumor necrosis factor receptor superfamily member 21 [Tripterygium wilfordii]
MWFGSLRGGGGGYGATGIVKNVLVRYFSRERAVNVRKINPKVPMQEANSIAQSLYDVIKQHGPLTVPNTWIQAKDSGINGLQSKTHMKIMLKWMRGRKMLKLFCNQVGNSKKFLHCTLPEDPQTEQSNSQPEIKLQTRKSSSKKKKRLSKKTAGKGKK